MQTLKSAEIWSSESLMKLGNIATKKIKAKIYTHNDLQVLNYELCQHFL